MNLSHRYLACLIFVAGAAVLGAQNPVIELERRDSVESNTWTGRATLMFRVTVLHPALRRGASERDFVLDPPGGWRSAIRLEVTDATGKALDWPFENMGKESTESLSLHRQGTASASFVLDPKADAGGFSPGRYQVRARLAATTGTWRGSVDSRPVLVDCVGRAQPGIEVIGAGEGTLMRGWPILLGVKVTAPDGYDGGLSVPNEEKGWATVINLALLDRAGVPVGMPIERLPIAELQQADMQVGASRTIWFRVTADATRSLGDGPYQWSATFSLPALRGAAAIRWTGSVSTTSTPFTVALPPAALTDSQARHHVLSHVEDALAEAKLLRARAEGGYMNDRTLAAQQAAVPLHRAERLAIQWHDSHPDDPSAAMMVANVMAAQEDKDRAIIYSRRAIAADQRQRAATGGKPVELNPALSLFARGFDMMPEERHAVLTPALRAALKDVRGGKLPLSPAPLAALSSAMTAPAGPAAPPSARASSPATPAPVPSPTVTVPLLPSKAARQGEPSLGKVIAAAELMETKILADTAGQWASAARAGSEYGRTQYSAAQATGLPNVPVAGNSPDAWCPAVRNVGMDWLLVQFANPASAVEVRVRQSDASGAIAKVEAIEPDGTSHVWWEGADPAKAPTVREIVWFAVRVPKTAYPVAQMKFTLNLASGPGYKQVDAVQLVAAP